MSGEEQKEAVEKLAEVIITGDPSSELEGESQTARFLGADWKVTVTNSLVPEGQTFYFTDPYQLSAWLRENFTPHEEPAGS